MTSVHFQGQSVEGYLADVPVQMREALAKLREVIVMNLPQGFEEQIAYGMISYVVPLSKYPRGYHAKKGEPLPFLAIAAQKRHIALYHMGLYGDPAMAEWFKREYAARVPTKLDMGKSCIRFKNPRQIPFDLIAELCRKMSVEVYIRAYEQSVNRA